MADDTDTDWAATADALEARANFVDPYALLSDEDLDNMRAAAVGLRRLAQLDTAARDLMDEIDPDTGLTDYKALERFAAVLGSGEQPEGPTT